MPAPALPELGDVGEDVLPGVGVALLFGLCAVAARWDGDAGAIVIRAMAVPIASGLAGGESGEGAGEAGTEASIAWSGAEIAALEGVSHPKTPRTAASATPTPIHSRRLKRSDSTAHSPTTEGALGEARDG